MESTVELTGGGAGPTSGECQVSPHALSAKAAVVKTVEAKRTQRTQPKSEITDDLLPGCGGTSPTVHQGGMHRRR